MAMESRPLKAATLTRFGACSEQRKLFRATFGKEAQITSALCLEHANQFDWDWAARHLLSASGAAAYDAARAEANAAYDAATAEANAAYDAAKAAPRAAYDAAMAEANAAWNAAKAEAFGTLYVQEATA